MRRSRIGVRYTPQVCCLLLVMATMHLSLLLPVSCQEVGTTGAQYYDTGLSEASQLTSGCSVYRGYILENCSTSWWFGRICEDRSSTLQAYWLDEDCCNPPCSQHGYDSCTITIGSGTLPVSGWAVGNPLNSSFGWVYPFCIFCDPAPVGCYNKYMYHFNTPGDYSCHDWDDGCYAASSWHIDSTPVPPVPFDGSRGSRLGSEADSFEGRSCGFPWPSIVNPVVYAPVSVPGGLGGPSDGMFYTGPSGSYLSRVEVYDTCQYDSSQWPEVSDYTYYLWARLIDRHGKCYVFRLGTRPQSGSIPFSFPLDDGSSMTGNLYSSGKTTFHIDYVDGTDVYFGEDENSGIGTPPHGIWVIRGTPTSIKGPEGNRTDTTYNLPEGGQQFDQVVTLPSDPANGETWKYYHNTGDPKILKIQQVATGASSVEIAYNGENPSQILVKDGAGQTVTQTDYTWANDKITMATRSNRKVTYGYTENGQVVTVEDIDTGTAVKTKTVYDYRQPDPNPNQGDTVSTLTTTITRKDPAVVNPAPDQVTYYCFYQSGGNKTYLRRVIGPDGRTTTYDVDTSNGRVISATDPDPSGLKTEYAYNTKGAVTTTTYSKTGMTSYHEHNVYYDNAGDTVWLKTHESIHPADDSSRGNFAYYARNSSTLWRVDAVKVNTQPGVEPPDWNAVSAISSYEYYGTDPDGLPGQLKKEIVPGIDQGSAFPDYEVSYKYTEGTKRRSSPTEVTYKCPNGSGGYDLKTSHATYDDLGNVLSTTDANATPRTITYQYDALGRQTHAVFGSGVQTENHYDGCCLMDWSTDEDLRKTSYAYDDMNRVTDVWTNLDTTPNPPQSQTNPLAHYEYDAFENVKQVTTRSDAGTARTTSYTYDNLNQVDTIIYPSPLGTEGFGYDSVGSLLWKKDGNNKYTVYKYDDLQRLTDVYYNYPYPSRPLNPPDYAGLAANVHYNYDGGTARVLSMVDDSGTSSYGYDTQSRLTSYTPPLPTGHAPVTYGYNNLGQKTAMSTTNLSLAYNYFANGWLKNVQSGGSTVASYTYDVIGNRDRVNFGNGTWQTFGYTTDTDPRYPLKTINYAYNCGAGIADRGGLKFTRDNSGNPVNWGDIADIYKRVYGYDKNSRLDSVTYPGHPAEGLAYDWVGNRGLPGSSYNDADQLGSRNGHAYDYDGAGNMTGDNDKVYAYAPDNLLQSLTIIASANYMGWDAAGNRVSFRSSTDYNHPYDFVYDPTAGIPAVIEETHNATPVYYIREPGGALICRKEGATTQYYHFDDLGSTLFLTGSDGAITDKYRYDAWGNATHDTGTTQQPYQYVGQLGYYTHYQDPNMAGLLQLGVRFYDPETGRFTQRDPVGDGMNWYGYVGSSPLSYVDPWGLEPKLTKSQCDIIRELLDYEKNSRWGPMRTVRTAWRFSNTIGKLDERLGPEFDDTPGSLGAAGIPSSIGVIDLDWFTDLMVARSLPVDVMPGLPFGIFEKYTVLKTGWNVAQVIKGHDLASLDLPYKDPKERVALKAIMLGKSYADLFPPDFMRKYCPCK